MNASFACRCRTLFVMVFCLSVLLSCSRKLRFETSTLVPAATGSVKYKKDKNDNYAVRANVLRLDPSTSLSPARDLYVFWIETQRNGVKNLGRINTKKGFLSKKLKANLNAVTPYEPRSFFITAENNADISYPGPAMVLRTR